MPAVIDQPVAGRPIDPVRFNVRGWVWLDESQPGISSIEAWSGERLLGESIGLGSRPDVVKALGLPETARPGFDFFADFAQDEPGTEFTLSIRARMTDGSQSPPLSQVRVQVRPASACRPRTVD